MSDINDILSALSSAKDAQERLPKVEAELFDTVKYLDETDRKLRDEQAHAARQWEEIQALREALTKREAELEAATFREAETRAKLETFRAMVSGALGTVTEAAAKVEVEAEAVEVEVAAEPEAEPKAEAPIESGPRAEAQTYPETPNSHTSWGDWGSEPEPALYRSPTPHDLPPF